MKLFAFFLLLLPFSIDGQPVITVFKPNYVTVDPGNIICADCEAIPEAPFDITAYLASHMHCRKDGLAYGIEGLVTVKFMVNQDGWLDSVHVLKRRNPSLDSEAIKVVKAMPRWKPATRNGSPIKSFYVLSVTFRLD